MNGDLKILNEINILLVDDEIGIIEPSAHFLTRRAKGVDTALDGHVALKLFEQKRHDIVISDIEMPKMDGYELYERIMEIDPSAKFLLLSGHSIDDIQDKFKDRVLLKPIDKDELIQKILSFF